LKYNHIANTTYATSRQESAKGCVYLSAKKETNTSLTNIGLDWIVLHLMRKKQHEKVITVSHRQSPNRTQLRTAKEKLHEPRRGILAERNPRRAPDRTLLAQYLLFDGSRGIFDHDVVMGGSMIEYWPGTNIVKSKGNAFDWRNQDKTELDKWMTHLAYVKRGVENASKKVDRDGGLFTADNVLFKMNIIAFSRAKGKKT